MNPPLLSHAFWPEVIGFVVSLFGCSLFSFLETSITALRPFRLKEIEQSSKKYRMILRALEHNPHRVLITILIANSLTNVTAAALSTTIMEQVFEAFNFSSSMGFSLGIGIGTCAMLIFGEVIPKSIAKVHGDSFFASSLWMIQGVYYILRPIATVLTRLSNFFIKFAGGKTDVIQAIASEPEIKFLIEHGMMEKEKSAMLQSIFKLGYKPVREIMVPSMNIIMLNSKAILEDALDLFSKYQFSRLPVYQDHNDNIIGMVYQKDIFTLISTNKQKEVRELVRPIMFVPESMKINQLLRAFRDQRMHIAMVTNEFGSITGLVTLEDVLEEIVGEITDEYEATTKKIMVLDQEKGWLVDGSVDLETLEKVLKITFEVENAITLGGFLTEQLQHVPVSGEKIMYQNYIFHVRQATQKRVVQVLIVIQDNTVSGGVQK